MGKQGIEFRPHLHRTNDKRMSMKKIVVQWRKTVKDPMYDKEMIVIESDHEQFPVGKRFDFGFMVIASEQGYIIELRPMNFK
jgi:hypothetical protein